MFVDPDSCGARVNIGESIDELADQAFVLIQREPFTTERTFIINCVSLGLSALWVLGSILIISMCSIFRYILFHYLTGLQFTFDPVGTYSKLYIHPPLQYAPHNER